MNSIRESVKEEMKGFQQRAGKFGKEAKTFTQEKGKMAGTEISAVAKRSGRSLGDVIVAIFKVFFYFIIGCIGFALVMALFALGVASIGIFPLKDFVINSGWQDAFAWGTLIFFIAIPIIGTLTWIIRRLAKARGNSKMIRLSFGCLWTLGWVCAIFLVSSVSKEFSHSSKTMTEQDMVLTNPGVNKLEITCTNALEKYSHNRWLRFVPFAGIEEDTAYIKNFDVRVMKSANDSFRVTMIKMAQGRSRNNAEYNASLIRFSGVQKDTVLQLDRGIAINTTDKFRNQSLVLTIYVPVGKHIMIDRSIGGYNNIHFNSPWNNDFQDFDFNDDSHNWNDNVEYIMKADGQLYTLEGKPAVEPGTKKVTFKDNGTMTTITTTDDNYRYNQSEPLNKLDSIKQKLEKEQIRMKDSLEKAKEKIDRQLEKLNDKNDEPLPLSYNTIPGYGLIMNIN